MIKKKSVVLLSGGLDSSVNLAAAIAETDVQLAITINYNQKSAAQELKSSKDLCEHYKVKHKVIDLPWFSDFATALTSAKIEIPKDKQIVIDDKKVSTRTALAVWVPNRNGVFLNIAAAYAESVGAGVVVPGFNAEEAATFPDNSYDYMRALRKSFSYSTANQVDVQCYTIMMTKIDIVKLGRDLGVPFEKIWPCYQALEKWCGECESCLRAKRAFKHAKLNMDTHFLK